MGSTSGNGVMESLGRRPRILLGVSGSVAAIKAPELSEALLEFADVKVVVTKAASHFFNELQMSGAVGPLLTDEGEWKSWRAKGDAVMHIDLRNWADMLVIAPLSANTLAKIAQGLCDNLLSSVFRAWDFSKPIVVAPAMNTHMWENPFTERHLDVLEDLGVMSVSPVVKVLACGDKGVGAMAAVPDIAKYCIDVLEKLQEEEEEEVDEQA
ncbi:hypothetical protein BSKO_11776 [Bryopsis sp. KO-2023]|nr:hypothetical protein BSKO_11776 [Bryopsis sp. KO-2023]